MNRKIPTFFGLLILIAGLVGGIYLVNSRTSLQTKAGPTESPKNIKVTNRGSGTVSISWTTDVPMTGYLRYSEDPAKINLPAGDVRDQISGTSQSYTNHYANITGLNPNKQYYFNIGSGSQTYNDNGRPFQFKTFASVSSPPEDVVSGKVINPDNSPVNGAIVFLDIEGSETLSTITKNDGTWRVNLSTARTKDGKILTIDPKTTALSIFVQAGTTGTATAVTNTEKARPVPDILIGKNQAFVESTGLLSQSSSDNLSSRSATFALTESQLSGALSLEASGAVLSAVTFLNPAIEGELIATSTPEFKLKLATGSALVIKVGEQFSSILTSNTLGEFVWSPTNELPKGLNTITAEYVDDKNTTQTISRSFNVLAVGDISGLPAFTATQSATIEITPSPTEATTMPDTAEEDLTDAGNFEQVVGLMLFGLILIIGGGVLKKKWQ